MSPAKNGISLKWGLMVIMAICWILPISLIALYSRYTIKNNVHEQIRDTIVTSVEQAFSGTNANLDRAMAASRASSYDGTIYNAYRTYRDEQNPVVLYDSMNTYLMQRYGYDNLFSTTFLFFTDKPNTLYYVSNNTHSLETESLRHYKSFVHDDALAHYPDMDTKIRFMVAGERLYMMRNLLDSRFEPYAVLIMEMNQNTLFENIGSIIFVEDAIYGLDNLVLPIEGNLSLPPTVDFDLSDCVDFDQETSLFTIRMSDESYGHALNLYVVADSAPLLDELPDVLNLLPVMVFFGAILFSFALWAYYHYFTRPMDALVEAAGHMEAGERGYTVAKLPRSREFRYLTTRFNSMSMQLKHQFEKNTEEQIALQAARVRALRSQINPHFLNNTLEAIAWSARMSGDEKVTRMIEALSTMLDAAMARSGKASDTVAQELVYADAYLYIVKERLGDRLSVKKEIEEATLSALVPCLILQPIVENAFDHGVALREEKGEIVIRSRIERDALILEVENNGQMTDKDRDKIAFFLDSDSEAFVESEGEHIGIRNVNRRLKILYGEEASLSIVQSSENRVLSRIVIPRIEYQR